MYFRSSGRSWVLQIELLKRVSAVRICQAHSVLVQVSAVARVLSPLRFARRPVRAVSGVVVLWH